MECFSADTFVWHQIELKDEKVLPVPRFSVCMVALSDSRFLIFGGKNEDDQCQGDICAFSEGIFIPLS
jgi:hypothetical protein